MMHEMVEDLLQCQVGSFVFLSVNVSSVLVRLSG